MDKTEIEERWRGAGLDVSISNRWGVVPPEDTDKVTIYLHATPYLFSVRGDPLPASPYFPIVDMDNGKIQAIVAGKNVYLYDNIEPQRVIDAMNNPKGAEVAIRSYVAKRIAMARQGLTSAFLKRCALNVNAENEPVYPVLNLLKEDFISVMRRIKDNVEPAGVYAHPLRPVFISYGPGVSFVLDGRQIVTRHTIQHQLLCEAMCDIVTGAAARRAMTHLALGRYISVAYNLYLLAAKSCQSIRFSDLPPSLGSGVIRRPKFSNEHIVGRYPYQTCGAYDIPIFPYTSDMFTMTHNRRQWAVVLVAGEKYSLYRSEKFDDMDSLEHYVREAIAGNLRAVRQHTTRQNLMSAMATYFRALTRSLAGEAGDRLALPREQAKKAMAISSLAKDGDALSGLESVLLDIYASDSELSAIMRPILFDLGGKVVAVGPIEVRIPYTYFTDGNAGRIRVSSYGPQQHPHAFGGGSVCWGGFDVESMHDSVGSVREILKFFRLVNVHSMTYDIYSLPEAGEIEKKNGIQGWFV